MKNVTTLLLVVFLFNSFSSTAQRIDLYLSKVKIIPSHSIQDEVQSGYLYEVNDSTIVLANIDSKVSRIVQKKMRDGDFQKIILRYSNIEKISLKRLNRARGLKFIVVGLTLTAISLAILYKPNYGGGLWGGNGSTNYNNANNSNNPDLFAIPFVLSIPLGIVSGSTPNNLENIHGNYSNFKQSKSELQKISFVEMNKN